ncbi:MAG: DNA repair protein RecO [Chloroflexi bacterium]|nr:MAG: DNA repair protein RecO [Chloroflexota bacterium]
MTTYRERAVILRKLDYGEADRIYTLLTAEHGKVPAIAKGVRRSASRLAAALELFAHVDVQLARGRGQLDVLTQAVRLPGARLAADPDRTAHASLIAELADRVSEDRHPIDGLYELTMLALNDLARDEDPRRASAYFLAQALEFLGYAPNLATCVVCERPLPPEAAFFSPPAGGLVCAADQVSGMLSVSVAALKVLRVAAAGDIGLYRRLKLAAALLDEVEAVLEAQVEHHLDRRLKSLAFLRRMRSPV